MNKRNFLLGKGERLAKDIQITSGGGEKKYPYTLTEAKDRVNGMLSELVDRFNNLPSEIFPDDLAIATITLNPEFIAKSYFPKELLKNAGLEAVGSRPKTILPIKRTRDRKPEKTISTEIFVRGTRAQFQRWSDSIPNLLENSKVANQICQIEEVSFPSPDSKLKNIPSDNQSGVFEIVLHINEEIAEDRYLGLFQEYLAKLGIDSSLGRRFYAGGLCFVELEAPAGLANDIASFSLVRVIRAMPQLRLLRPAFRGGTPTSTSAVELPNEDPIDPNIKAAIFDGGIPQNHPLTKWATPHDVPGLAPPYPDLMAHGVAVTSAFLFGHIIPNKSLPRPYCYVDHYRVVDDSPGQNPYELFEILDRIIDVLNTKQYDLINLSLGPRLPIDDDEVHVWTAVLDEYLSDGATLATIAVGNDGDGDIATQANRIQVPSDCVNALSIGACDVPDSAWQRAVYSSVGPGRSPGLIKPDLVEFGGGDHSPFFALDVAGDNLLNAMAGTSFSAPSALRLAAGVKAHFGQSLNMLAIRALLVHCSEPSEISPVEVGWGRVARSLDDIVLCEDHVIRVVYQGSITASKYIRIPIPVPNSSFSGIVSIKATICYATGVDPHHPDNYTRSGLVPIFRKNKTDFKDGAVHPKSTPFFNKSRKSAIPLTEEELRNDAWKWENCIHATKKFKGSALLEPTFDLHYNARLEGHNDTSSQKIQYAIVITVDAPSVNDLYDQVVRKYATQLEAIKPIIEIPIKTNNTL